MNVPNNYYCPIIKTYGRWRGACARAEWRVWYRSNGTIMLRKAIWEKRTAKDAKIIRLSLKYSKTNSPKLWNNFLTCLCLLRFVEATKLGESSEFSNCVQNVWARVASLVKSYVNLKNFCTARKRSRYEFSGTVLCRTCLSRRKGYVFILFIPLFSLILLSKIVCSLCLHRGLTTAQTTVNIWVLKAGTLT